MTARREDDDSTTATTTTATTALEDGYREWAKCESADVRPLSAGGRTVRLLSYNFLIRPPPITYNGNDYKDERIAALVGAHLAHYDIVCLQEVFGLLSTRRRRLIAGAARVAGLVHSVHSPGAFPAVTDGGCVVLSRYPIVAHASVDYACGMNADMLARKGALYARVEVRPGTCMHVFTTHLQADYKKNVGRQRGGNAPNERMRRAQLRTLAAFVRRHVDPCLAAHGDWPIVLLGDLNINSRRAPTDGADSAEYRAMLAVLARGGLGARDLLAECHGGTHPVTICDSVVLPDGSLQSTEPQLTPHNEFHWRRSIDYILLLRRDPSLVGTTSPDYDESEEEDDDYNSGCCCCCCRGLCGRGGHGDAQAQHKKDDGDAAAVGTPSAAEATGLLSEDAGSSSSATASAAATSLPPAVHPVEGVCHTVVEPFDAHRPDRPYNHLSDHYGVRSLWTV